MENNNGNVIEGAQESVEELIIRLCVSVKGVGKATAGAIASDFSGDLQAFLNSDALRLSQIRTSSGKQLLNDGMVTGILTAKEPIPHGLSIQETWVFYLGRQFLKAQVSMVLALTFQDFDINPLLAKALNLDSPRKVIAFNVYQTVTRSVVTSWGDTVEQIAKFVGCKDNDFIIEGKTGTNFDLMKNLGGTDYYIQIKSGPNTMNVGMVTSLNEAIQKIETTKPHAKGILGMTYGTRNRISNQILGNLKDANNRMKVGRELWDFISEKTDFHNDLFRLLDNSSKGLLDKSFIELIESKITEFEEYWKTNFEGLTVDKVLEKYI
jgi:hypothetical protein